MFKFSTQINISSESIVLIRILLRAFHFCPSQTLAGIDCRASYRAILTDPGIG